MLKYFTLADAGYADDHEDGDDADDGFVVMVLVVAVAVVVAAAVVVVVWLMLLVAAAGVEVMPKRPLLPSWSKPVYWRFAVSSHLLQM